MHQPPRLVPALITPFTTHGEIELDSHAHNVATLAGRGITGFLIAGSTGEGPYLEQGERTRLVTTAGEAAPRAFLLCGIAAESLRGALGQAEEAAAGGADAVLALTPTALVRGRHDLVARFYSDLADKSPLPLFLYSVPRVTGYELPTDVVTGLRGHPAIAGMKDSGGQPVRIPAMLNGAPEGFFMYTGSTPAITLSIAAGARGAITASANYAAELVLDVVRAAVRSPRSAAASQALLLEVAAAIEQHGIGAVKAAAGMVGLRPGTVRKPLINPSPSVRRRLQAALRGAGIASS